MYYIRGSHFCAAIVQFYRTYSLYYLVICVSSDSCALYLYYFASPTQILRLLAAPTQLVLYTTCHSPPPLKIQWWRSCSGAHVGAPVPAGANIRLSHPSHPASNQPAHKSQCFLIQPIRYNPIAPIRYDPAGDTIRSS